MLRIISDVHSNVDKYVQISKQANYSFQLGDMFYRPHELNKLCSDQHKIGQGNHNDMNLIERMPYFIGRYGMKSLGGVDFFWVGGAFSVDLHWRLMEYLHGGPKTWWEREQLNFEEMLDCYEQYCDYKPNVVITHTCPTTISNMMFGTSDLKRFGFEPNEFFCHTASLLDRMWRQHKPDFHYMGHFHRSKELRVHGTLFKCLAELEYIDINEKGEPV